MPEIFRLKVAELYPVRLVVLSQQLDGGCPRDIPAESSRALSCQVGSSVPATRRRMSQSPEIFRLKVAELYPVRLAGLLFRYLAPVVYMLTDPDL